MNAQPNWAEQARGDTGRLGNAELCNVMDAIPAMVWIASPDGKGTHINRAWTEYLGLSLEDTVGFGWTKTVHPDDIDRYLAAWRVSLATGQPLEEEVRYRRAADGQYRWFLSRGIPVRDERGNIVKWFGVGTDIEDRKQAEEAAHKRENELRELIEALPAMAWSAALDGSCTFVNRNWTEYTGLSLEETVGLGWLHAVHSQDAEQHLSSWRESVATGQPFQNEVRFRRAVDGEYRWFTVRSVPLRDERGTILKWYGIATDIEDRKRAEDAREEAARRSERELRAVIERIPAMVWITFADGTATFVNRGWTEYFGLSLEDILGWGWSRTVHPDDAEQFVGKWRASLATGQPLEQEVRFRRADGAYRWFLIRGVPVRDEHGDILNWYGVGTDIEDRKRAEAASRRTEKELRDLIDNMPAMAFALLPDGSYLYLTKQWTEYSGLSLAESEREGWSRAIHPEDLEQHFAKWHVADTAGQPFESEARFRRAADGEYRWFLVRATPLREDGGTIAKWYGVLTDITDRKQVEDALRRNEEKLRESEYYLAEAQRVSKTGSWAANRGDPGIRYWSDECYRVLGFDPRNGLPAFDQFFQRMHPDDQPVFSALGDKAIVEKTNWELDYRILHPDGQYRYIHVLGHPLLNSSGDVVEFIGTVIDITERRQAEEATHAAKARLEGLVQIAQDAIISVDSHQRIILFNQGAEKIFGYGQAEVVGSSLDVLLPERFKDVHRKDIEDFLRSPDTARTMGQRREVSGRRKDGSEFPAEASISKLNFASEVVYTVILRDITDRKRAEDALRRSEKELRDLIENLPGMAWVVTPDGRHPYVSTQFQEFTGLSAADVDAGGGHRVIHPEDLAADRADWSAALATGTPYEHEARFRRASDGEYRWLINRARPLRDDTGRVVKWYGLSTDIEDRKRAQEALRRSEQELRDLIENMPAMALALLPDGSHLYLTKQWTEYTGLSVAETNYEGWARTVHPDDVERHIKTWRACAETGQPFESEARFRRADGVYRWFLVRATPLRDGTGNIAKWHGILTDIEDRKRADEKLRENEFYLAEAQRLSKTGSWAANRGQPGIRYLSEEWYRVMGFDSRDGLPTFEQFLERMHPDDRPLFSALGDKAIAERTDWELDYRFLHSDGKYRYIHVLGHPVLNSSGDLIEFVGTVIDITERKLAEQERERLRRLEAELAHMNRVSMMGELAASLAHELKQPIAAAVMNAEVCFELLNRDRPDIPELRDASSAIVRCAKRAAGIIDRVRALYRKSTPQRELVDVNEFIHEMDALLQNQARLCSVTVHLQLADNVPQVMGDRVQLQQVVMNLMLNAIEAMSDTGGEIIVASEVTATGQVLISVGDTGPGISEDKEGHIFDAFFTTKPQGTGMGLAISRSIVESHGGRLWATTNAGRGATFYLQLPQQAVERV